MTRGTLPRPGELVAGRYRVREMLGRGGMGAVFLAEQLSTERPVAVKWLLPDITEQASEEARARFQREARITAGLSHPNLVTVFDVGEHEGATFVVMEALQGETLTARIRRGPLAITEALNIAASVLRGLSVAHSAHVLHRDIKPDNIFLHSQRDGSFTVKVLDFGIASLEDGHDFGAGLSQLTQTGAVVGTPRYMAPERLRSVTAYDERSDLYSVGVVLYEMLSGKLPHDADSLGELIVRVVTTAPPPLGELCPTLPEAVCQVVHRAIAAAPEERYTSAAEMLNALHAVAAMDSQAAPAHARATSTPSPPPASPFNTEALPVHAEEDEEEEEEEDGDEVEPSSVEAPSGAFRWGARLFPALMVIAGLVLPWAARQSPGFFRRLTRRVLSGDVSADVRSALGTRISSAVCALDANGDEVLDIVGLQGMSNEGDNRIVALDGRDGATIFEADGYRFPSFVACPGDDWLLIYEHNARSVDVRNVRTPGAVKRIPLSDKLSEWGVGEGCLALQAIDQKTIGLRLDDLEPVACHAKHMRSVYSPEGKTDRKTVDLKRHDTTARLTTKAHGTPLLQLRLGDNTTTFPFARPTMGLLYAQAGRYLAVAGTDPERDRRTVLIGIDLETGREAFVKELCDRNLAMTSLLAAGDQFVFTEGWSGLWVVDAKTGETRWQAGACP